MIDQSSQFGWKDSKPTDAHEYLFPVLVKHIQKLYNGRPITLLDLGCGNGHLAFELTKKGYSVMAIDASKDGIDIARSAYPNIQFEVCSIYDNNLEKIIKPVDCIVSLEVVEHLFYPKILFEKSYRILKRDVYFILSTPYHGYLKNLAISIINGWDNHFTVHWDGGHIKFFSKKTLTAMAHNAGFKNPYFLGVGRFPGLWKSMIMIAQK